MQLKPLALRGQAGSLGRIRTAGQAIDSHLIFTLDILPAKRSFFDTKGQAMVNRLLVIIRFKRSRLLLRCVNFELQETLVMGKLLFATGVILATLGVASCAKPTVVDVVMPGDENLNCGQLQNAYAEANRLKAEASSEKGWTGENVARGLLFWPAIVGTNMNANEAINAADSRKVHLANIMRAKGCEVPQLS